MVTTHATDKDNGSPWWIKAIDKFGVPTVIALWMVYWITQTLTPQIDAQSSEILQIKGMVTAHADASGRTSAESLFYNRQQCLILARLANFDAEMACNPRADYGILYSRELSDPPPAAQPKSEERTSGHPAGRMFDR